MSLILYLLFLPDMRALGAPDFATRERAEARLARHADLVWRLLPLHSPDIEVRRRARRVRAWAIPQDCPPIAFLGRGTIPEWGRDGAGSVIGAYPGRDWYLVWIQPRPGPWDWLITHYHERARTQAWWPNWQLAGDSREATRLLVNDLARAGVPACLVRALLAQLHQREQMLYHRPGLSSMSSP